MLDTILCGDCLRLMRDIPDHSIDLVLCDLPYGTTRNKWDSPIPLDALWVEYRRIIRPRGAIVLFAQIPFSITLGASNLPWLKYEWIWQKEQGTGHLNSGFCPMKNHENILVFSPAAAAQVRRTPEAAMIYHPQYRTGRAYKCQHGNVHSQNYDAKNCHDVLTTNDGQHYQPLTVLRYAHDRAKVRGKGHATQKPVALLRYIIRTYTDPGMTVLDNCMGSGSTIEAAIREHRHYIGMELDPAIFAAAQERINAVLSDVQDELEIPE